MRLHTPRKTLRRSSIWCALVCTAFTWLFNWLPELAEPWRNFSYDFPFALKSEPPPQDVVIIYLDEKTYADLGQTPTRFDRKLYAPVLDHLTRSGARLVLMDLYFSPEDSGASDAILADAIRRNGRVVLVNEKDEASHREVTVSYHRPPSRVFLEAGATNGISRLILGRALIPRQVDQGTSDEPGVVWVAAAKAGLPITQRASEPDNSFFLRFYSPPQTLRSVSFSDVTGQPSQMFSNRYAFIGSLPTIRPAQTITDQFYAPRMQSDQAFLPGVEALAVSFLNLLREDGLRRIAPSKEMALMLCLAAVIGGAMVWFRPWWAAAVSVLLVLGIGWFSCTLVWKTLVWWNWTWVVSGIVPAALLWSLLTNTRVLKREKDEMEITLTRTIAEAEQTRMQLEASKASASVAKASPVPPPSSPPSPSPIPVPPPTGPPVLADHSLLKCVGRGGYGEVWLARNALGLLHVIKIIHRRNFTDAAPYEREFRGIQKFMPVSRSHPGFVHVLHAGRNDELGFFYYVMEAGDDERTAQAIDPDNYAPKTLGSELRRAGPLTGKQCIELGSALADALHHLHQQQLIHRDVKPANIIYVAGKPKLADIGLVTRIESTDADVSRLGTEGYMAPEGPGTASSDVYSLGKVLYEACMGLDRRRFPELPTALYDAPDSELRMMLNRTILRACEPRPEDRYQTAEELAADLRLILSP
ncbi:MAG: CHASE2 domain-containing protein [Verrucomicrobia bacterium]|nr:CHASE2 domain-containing protein [Verrucomicrobiota bacterium]